MWIKTWMRVISNACAVTFRGNSVCPSVRQFGYMLFPVSSACAVTCWGNSRCPLVWQLGCVWLSGAVSVLSKFDVNDGLQRRRHAQTYVTAPTRVVLVVPHALTFALTNCFRFNLYIQHHVLLNSGVLLVVPHVSADCFRINLYIYLMWKSSKVHTNEWRKIKVYTLLQA